jgi:hypothetical protein
MRKHTGFATAATILAVLMVLWAKSSVEATSSDISRPKAPSSHGQMSSAVLSTHAIDPVY